MNSTERLSFICMIAVFFALSIWAISLELTILFIPFATGTISAIIIYTMADKKQQKDLELFTDKELEDIFRHQGREDLKELFKILDDDDISYS